MTDAVEVNQKPSPKKEKSKRTPGAWLVIRKAAQLTAAEWPKERIMAVVRFLQVDPPPTPAEWSAFFALCNEYRLDPFVGQIFLVPGEKGYKVGVERDGFLAIAEQVEGYLGHITGAFYEQDQLEITQENESVVVRHTVNPTSQRGALLGAYCVVRRTGRPDVCIIRRYQQYKHLHSKRNWLQYAEDMVINRAMAAAHRRMLPIKVYLRDEIEAGSGTPELEAAAAEQATGRDRLLQRLNREGDPPSFPPVEGEAEQPPEPPANAVCDECGWAHDAGGPCPKEGDMFGGQT